MKKWLAALSGVVEIADYRPCENEPPFTSSSRHRSLYLESRTMETVHDAEGVTRHRPLTIAIPTERGIVLVKHVPSADAARVHEMSPCPAYRICRELKGPHRSAARADDHDRQVGNVLV